MITPIMILLIVVGILLLIVIEDAYDDID